VKRVEETDISRAILEAYHEKFLRALRSDVLIVGAGPSGLMAAWKLAEAALHVTVLEKRLSAGGGVWGGSMGMNEVAVQPDALPLLEEAGVRHAPAGELSTVDASELACGLCLRALRSGATLLTLVAAEDLCVHAGRVTGVVANRSLLGEQLPIDPITLSARAVIDATGHEMVLVNHLRQRGLIPGAGDRSLREGPMDASAGEEFVIENVKEIFPGLWITGMSVCAALGGPRMGPIFGGMLLSGAEVARQVAEALGRPAARRPKDSQTGPAQALRPKKSQRR
jgi:thiamine thiazole synthase